MTLSYVLCFIRSEGQKSYEKQIISLGVHSGVNGFCRVSFRSTEVTWPSSIYPLIEREINSWSKRTLGEPSWAHSRLMFLSRSMAGNYPEYFRTRADKVEDLFSSARVVLLLAALLLGLSLLISSILRVKATGAYILAPDRSGLIKIDAAELVKSSGVDAALNELSRGEILARANFPVNSGGVTPALLSTGLHLTPIFSVFFFWVFAFAFANIRAVALLREESVVRIFIGTERISPRSKPDATSGFASSLVFGVLAGLLATAIWGLFRTG